MATLTIRNSSCTAYPVKFGLMYNWYAVVDPANISNTGWHVPSISEIEALITYLGGSTVSGGKLKDTGTTYWESPNTGATNEVGFNGRGSGLRISGAGSFTYQMQFLYLWSTTETDATKARYGNIAEHDDIISPNTTVAGSKVLGCAVRLIKDSTSLSHGQTGTYTGNDGKVYRTICIGTQEWLADNLLETRYRNGDAIPEVTDNSTWAAMTTDAMCAYLNVWDNA